MEKQKYDFRKKLLEVHKKDIRDYRRCPEENEFEISDGARIVIDKNASEVIVTAAWDFVDYLFTSQGISARIVKGNRDDGEIYVGTKNEIDADLQHAASYKGFMVDVSKKILVCGFDDRGAAQGLYFLEEEMSRRCAPYIEKKITRRKPLFSPRMLHSGYGLDEYPDAHLSAIAHSGRDAILVFVKGVNMTPDGFSDFNNLIYRAAKYGIDVYAYSKMKVLTHPEDDNADAAYEATYGTLFRNCPGFRGVTLVGESVQFASRDERVQDISKASSEQSAYAEADPRPLPGWWPCNDYCKWVSKVRDTIRKYKPEADVVFWTYNWGWAPEEDRLALIRSLPRDISLLVTFEMAQQFRLENITERCDDYTLSFEGPGAYFLSEAKEAKKCGIRLYSMTNTGGLTWDIGTIPYEPMPYQWMRRYKEMIKANEKYGLCGLMETHHYGFYPSFIGDLSNVCLCDTEKDMTEHLGDILEKHYGKENVEVLKTALQNWSEAIRHFIPRAHDQYGPFRVGPAYPLLFMQNPRFDNVPSASYAQFGNRIVYSDYGRCDVSEWKTLDNRLELSVFTEKRELERALDYLNKGLELMGEIKEPNEELSELINLGEYIKHTVVTGINTKRWFIAKNKLERVSETEKNPEVFEELESILSDEHRNAEETIPIVERDSRLGWEPSMEYIGHKQNIQWKLRQLEYVRDVQLPIARKRFGNVEYPEYRAE